MTSLSNSNSTGSEEGRIKEVIVDSRINKILAMRTDSVTMLEALDAISEFYIDNTVDARRMLKQDLELQNIQLAKKFLAEFDQVKNRIDTVELLSNNLESSCQQLATKVKDSDENMKSFMEKASYLENRRNILSSQSNEIESFLSRFQLSSSEVDLLYHANLDISNIANSFFEALTRLRSAYSDCKDMVEKNCYSVGFELLEVLGQHQDVAYRHLFEWVKRKCEALAENGVSEDIDTNTKLQIAIRFLKTIPMYFSQCQDLLVNSRRTQLVQKFIIALTQGETTTSISKNLRAIDLHSHDAVKYVGGMLAWMHQTIASEQEFLEAIFGEYIPSHNSPDSPKKVVSDNKLKDENNNNLENDESKLGSLTIPELLARCLQGLGRPLRVRVTQTLETKSSVEMLYSMTDLLTFYEATLHRIVPIENAVHSAVKGCLLECKRLFATILQKQTESLLQSPVSYPLDLKASHVTRECANQIQEILKAYSFALSPLPDPSDPCHIDNVLGNIIQPLLQSCRLGCQSLSQGEMAIFMLNNVSLIQLEIKEAAKRSANLTKSGLDLSWFSLLETENRTWVEVLVQEEVGRTLKRSDLDKLLELMEVVPSGLVAVQQVGLGQDRVGTVMRAFYASLFSTVAPQFERLHDPILREVIRNSTSDKISQAHDKIHKFISLDRNGYDKSILSHTTDEVRVLLGCDANSSNNTI